MHPVYSFSPYFRKIYSNIIFSSTPRLFLPFRFPYKIFVRIVISPIFVLLNCKSSIMKLFVLSNVGSTGFTWWRHWQLQVRLPFQIWQPFVDWSDIWLQIDHRILFETLKKPAKGVNVGGPKIILIFVLPYLLVSALHEVLTSVILASQELCFILRLIFVG